MTEDWKKLEGRIFKTDVNSTTEEAMKDKDAAVIHYTTDGDIVFNGVKFCEAKEASNSVSGTIKVGQVMPTLSVSSNQRVKLDKNGYAYIPIATSLNDGLITKENIKKILSIEENANNYVLPNATSEAIGGVKLATLDLQSEYEFLKAAPTITDIDEAKEAINHFRVICKTLIDKLEEAGTLTH